MPAEEVKHTLPCKPLVLWGRLRVATLPPFPVAVWPCAAGRHRRLCAHAVTAGRCDKHEVCLGSSCAMQAQQLAKALPCTPAHLQITRLDLAQPHLRSRSCARCARRCAAQPRRLPCAPDPQSYARTAIVECGGVFAGIECSVGSRTSMCKGAPAGTGGRPTCRCRCQIHQSTACQLLCITPLTTHNLCVNPTE